jgi:murein DD-endopeptidase MepM/ murein hydrolase activator NlpD
MPFRLKWPTQFDHIIQRFGENKTGDPNFYTQFGLPAHEGLDFVAPTGTEVYACADGVIKMTSNGHDGHAYGIHVRITHLTPEGEFETIYAHLQELQAGIEPGVNVTAGDLIGRANNTGHSRGEHLHLTLKKKGATARGETNYPRDIIDPFPFLDAFDGAAAQPRLTDNLVFVADVTIPDGSLIPAGAQFIKTWRVRNQGTTEWGQGYVFIFSENTPMAQVTEMPLPPSKPGEESTISITLTAPSEPGRYKSTWQAHNPDGRAFGNKIFVLIRVAR